MIVSAKELEVRLRGNPALREALGLHDDDAVAAGMPHFDVSPEDLRAATDGEEIDASAFKKLDEPEEERAAPPPKKKPK